MPILKKDIIKSDNGIPEERIMNVDVRQLKNYFATLSVCSDKSVTVRAVLLGGIADGRTEIVNPLICEDTLVAIDCVRKMGATAEFVGNLLYIDGAKEIADGQIYDCKRSGTVLRLLCGILAGASVKAVLIGDEQLKNRPIGRITAPLTARGAKITTENGRLPISIFPSKLSDYTYEMPVDSAQVKSAIILSGVTGGVSTTVTERNYTRDHTERMLSAMGLDVTVCDKNIVACPGKLNGIRIEVPGDPSAAAFYIALGLCKGYVKVKSVNISKKRAWYLYKLKEYGADIVFENERTVGGEQCADIIAKKSEIGYIEVNSSEVAALIDELPIIGLIGGLFNGICIKSAAELRVKESDRFGGIIQIINLFGGQAFGKGDDIYIDGKIEPKYFEYSSDDHRLTMTAFVAMCCGCGGKIIDAESVNKSFPDFFKNFYEFNACLIGGNVEQSFSGFTHNYFLERLNKLKNYSYELLSVDGEKAEEIIKKSGYKSINVTIPYKETAFSTVKSVTRSAKLSRSVNFIYNEIGYSFDGEGLIYSLKMHNVEPQGKSFLICGAGGAGRSVALALSDYGAKVYLKNRTDSKVDEYLNYLSGCGERVNIEKYDGKKCDVIINATALKIGLPIDEDLLSGCEFALDINYGTESDFIKAAKRQGVRVTDGKEMLFAQSYFADALVSDCDSDFIRFFELYKQINR